MCDEEQNDQDGMIEYPENRQYMSLAMTEESAKDLGFALTIPATPEGKRVVDTRYYLMVEVDFMNVEEEKEPREEDAVPFFCDRCGGAMRGAPGFPALCIHCGKTNYLAPKSGA